MLGNSLIINYLSNQKIVLLSYNTAYTALFW